MTTRPITTPATHPHLATLDIEPAEFGKFRRLTENSDEVRLLQKDRQGERLILHIGCISREAARRMEDGWN